MSPETRPQKLNFDERIEAVEAAIDAYHAYLEGYLTRLTGNQADAEDLMSTLWVYVLHHFKDEYIKILPVLRRKAYQLFVDHYRKKTRERESLGQSVDLEIVGSLHLGKEAYNGTEENLLQERFWREFPVALSPQQREVLWLSARHGFTIKDIAARLDIPSSTVGDWLQLARTRLADHLNDL